jgi:hypothetical protein
MSATVSGNTGRGGNQRGGGGTATTDGYEDRMLLNKKDIFAVVATVADARGISPGIIS